MKYFNSNLITLKCVLFLFFGAIGCVFPFLPLHMTSKGLSSDESRIISIVAPCIALIGPAIAGPLADRLAGGFGGSSRSKTGTYLRVMIALCCFISAIFYWLLAIVPTIIRSPPTVSFSCDNSGGIVYQDKCGFEQTCYNWDPTKRGFLYVTDCRFACETYREKVDITTIFPSKDVVVNNYDTDEYNEEFALAGSGEDQLEATADDFNFTNNTNNMTPLPHICYQDELSYLCEVYTNGTKYIKLNINLHPPNSEDDAEENDTCEYAIGSNFKCRISQQVERNLTRESAQPCRPVIKCNISQPYEAEDSMLRVTECGYNNKSFWLYLFIRSIADMFPAAAVALLATAVVIATRETSTGRGDVGKQLAAGALGFAVFAPLVGAIDKPVVSLILFSVLMVLSGLILLVDSKMPLSPPEWWWHTRCGLLALPMSSVKNYGLEIGALTVILTLLGIFWSALDSYMPWHMAFLNGSMIHTGLAITAGSLPAVIFLIEAEKIVDYCGHTNILIAAFTFYIIHYTGLTFVENPDVLIVFEALEIFTLHLMWITAILYFRHLVPRKFTASGQALAVVAHFCIGRFLGALIGGIAYPGSIETFNEVHKWFAVAAAIIAAVYFIAYHLYLKPRCVAPTQHPPRPAPAIVQSMNGNGSYTPLRVYHNGRAKKGQFRY